MNYELAKKLKDVGFPQKDISVIVGNEDSFVADPFHLNEYFYVPSLSELIEACGNEFSRLTRNKDLMGIFWRAVSSSGIYSSIISNTPEEAVANLWLELNKKK